MSYLVYTGGSKYNFDDIMRLLVRVQPFANSNFHPSQFSVMSHTGRTRNKNDKAVSKVKTSRFSFIQE